MYLIKSDDNSNQITVINKQTEIINSSPIYKTTQNVSFIYFPTIIFSKIRKGINKIVYYSYKNWNNYIHIPFIGLINVKFITMLIVGLIIYSLFTFLKFILPLYIACQLASFIPIDDTTHNASHDAPYDTVNYTSHDNPNCDSTLLKVHAVDTHRY